MKALGLDLSISGTGMVLLEENPGGNAPVLLMEVEVNPKGKGIARHRGIATAVMVAVSTHKPEAVVIEGYVASKFGGSSILLHELGGIVRMLLHIDGWPWYEPSPGELKKFVCGKGNAPKDQMMMQILKRWGHESQTNNTADAYGLACMGLGVLGCLPLNQSQKELTGKLVRRSA